jgi:hypothetical protein
VKAARGRTPREGCAGPDGSAADLAAVLLGDDHDRRARRHPVLEVRPARRRVVEGRDPPNSGHWSPSLPGYWIATNRVLPSGVNIGPHSSPAGRATEEQLGVATRLAFGLDRPDAVGAAGRLAAVAVGRDPQPALRGRPRSYPACRTSRPCWSPRRTWRRPRRRWDRRTAPGCPR